ncbi:MAG: hypothetical protein ACRDRT_03850, partial [Pseudonocardiaceae bacterium]
MSTPGRSPNAARPSRPGTPVPLSGATPPEKRLPMAMERLRSGIGPARAAAAALRGPPSPFPYTAPTWPDS